MKENGSSPPEIVAATGCSRQTIYPLWNKWRKSKNKEKTIEVKNAADHSDMDAPLREYRKKNYKEFSLINILTR
jgi:hypothetical protein